VPLRDEAGQTPHILLDELGAWAVLLSPQDYGYLVAYRGTSRAILRAWQTTPSDEIDRYIEDVGEAGREELAHDWEHRVIDYARAGLWE
jgi:hypothetical protein